MSPFDAATKRRRMITAALPLAVALLSLGSPWVATGSASSAGGADQPRPATFGDCPHDNAGLHNGYDCAPVIVFQ